MADLIFNIALGRSAYYAGLPAADDSLIMIPLEASGIPSDATLRDLDDVAAILATAANEQTTMGRKTLAGVTATVTDGSDVVNVTFDDVTWTAATGNAISDLLVAYKPAAASADSACIPLWLFDFPITPDGSDVVATAPADLYGSTQA